MTEIKLNGDTYRGTAEGDHGVITNNSDGTVDAGRIIHGCACVGVSTRTSAGYTVFVEYGADGRIHGRVLGCDDRGNTAYSLNKYGSAKEWAVLHSNGTCTYNNMPCSADYPPFVALQAMVLPIKARPHQSDRVLVPCHSVPQQPPHSRIFSAPTACQSVHRPCFGARTSWQRPTPTRRALLRLHHWPAWALWAL
jgi:hypothetical protein